MGSPMAASRAVSTAGLHAEQRQVTGPARVSFAELVGANFKTQPSEKTLVVMVTGELM